VMFLLLGRYCQPKTVKPISLAMFVIYFVVVSISIPVILLDIRTPLLTGLKLLFEWTNSIQAIGAVRAAAPLLFAAMLALWPAARSPLWRVAILIAALVSIFGALVSAGRIAIVSCLVEAILFCLLRRKLWLMFPVFALTALLAGFITANPNSLYSLPNTAHRALTPFNFSEHETNIEKEASSSNAWHEDLRSESLRYWASDLKAFLVGHGFKGWDESLSFDPNWTRYYEDAKKLAIQMGQTENAFSSVTNIFGLVGLTLYLTFLLSLASRLRRARKACPHRSYARALCDFSLVSLYTFALFSPFAGGIPGINIIYWQIGLLAARPYLVKLDPNPKPNPFVDGFSTRTHVLAG
jgi:hypothetical protein